MVARTLRGTASGARRLWYGALISGGITGALIGGIAADTVHAHRRAARARRSTTTPEGARS